VIEISAVERVFLCFISNLLRDHIGARSWNRLVTRGVLLDVDLGVGVSGDAKAELSSVGAIRVKIALLFVGSRSWGLACEIKAESLLFRKKLDLSP
jgi:hypothetical protein